MNLFGKKKDKEEKPAAPAAKKPATVYQPSTGSDDVPTATVVKPAAPAAAPKPAAAVKPAATTTVKPAATTTVKPAATTTAKPSGGFTVKPAEKKESKPTFTVKPAVTAPTAAEVEALAKEVIQGKWGNGAERKEALEKAGHNYDTVQAKVNELLTGQTAGGASVETLAKEVIQGKWGNGADRKAALEKAGYNYDQVQAKVNELLSGTAPAAAPAKSVEEVAREVIQGKWGNGADRKAALEKAGYSYDEVQAKVNALLK